ncbi:uncharacterized protein isoform X2 [Rhodnius prolixus]|uniref:uncharacterized protein isoform X2 n=1 Tax=Rhodnius prolixus TaxID=13249 RepID=UPI003D18FAFE
MFQVGAIVELFSSNISYLNEFYKLNGSLLKNVCIVLKYNLNKWNPKTIKQIICCRCIKKMLMTILRSVFWQQQQIQEAIQPINEELLEPIMPDVKRRKVSNSSRREVFRLIGRQPVDGGLEEIAGLDNVKAILRKSVLLPLQFPTLFTGGRRPWNQILLYGPPGTGKSKIATALAAEAKVQLYCISSADILSSWVGESEKMIKDLFEYTRSNNEKCIVFIDEIDSICRQRTNKEGDHTRSIKNQLLIELDQNITVNCNSFILCATNCPWDIDTAFMRRFQCRIFVPLPDKDSRLKIIKNQCKGINTDLTEEDWSTVVSRTEGYSGSDLTNLTTYAIQEPLAELDSSQSWKITKDSKWMPCTSNIPGSLKAPLALVPADKIVLRNVTMKDFTKAILVTPKTVTASEIDKYKKFSSIRG